MDHGLIYSPAQWEEEIFFRLSICSVYAASVRSAYVVI